MSRPVSTAEITDLEPLLINPAGYTLEHNTLMKELVVTDRLKERMGRTKHTPYFGQVEAFAADEAVEVTNPQVYSVTDVEFTPAEIVCQVILTDKAVRTSGEDQVRATGKLMGDAMSRKCDRTALDLFPSFTTHALGSSGSPTAAIALTKISASVTRLKGNTSDPAPSPIYLVARPEQLGVLQSGIVGSAVGTASVPSGISQEVLQEYLAHDFKFYGLQGGFSGNITRTSSGTVGDANTYAVGAVFSKQAIRYVPADDMNVERERLVRARSWLFQSSHDFTFGIYKNKWGVSLTYNATDPS